MISSMPAAASELASAKERLFPNQGIAPLPSLGTASGATGTTTVPLPSLAERTELTRMPSFQQPTAALSSKSGSSSNKVKNETTIKSSSEPSNNTVAAASGEDSIPGPSSSSHTGNDERDDNCKSEK